MRYMYLLIVISIISVVSTASASDPSSGKSVPSGATALIKKCNLEARNALINGDIQLVETICMKAVNEIEQSAADKKLIIDPLLNLAYSYTLAGLFEKATPLYERALSLSNKLYKPDSRESKKIDELYNVHKEMKRRQEG